MTKFLTAIGYPLDEIGTEEPVTLLVDDMRVQVRDERGGLILRYVLGKGSLLDVAQIAGFAAGRMLKEEAVLAYDRAADEVILWQKLPANEALMKTGFELFMSSCEWWRAAVDAQSRGGEGLRAKVNGAEDEMRIMP